MHCVCEILKALFLALFGLIKLLISPNSFAIDWGTDCWGPAFMHCQCLWLGDPTHLGGEPVLDDVLDDLLALLFWDQALIPVVERFEGASQPQWVIWVIRLTSPHLPYLGQAATGAA